MGRRARITATGIVQGVGFRPHVYNLAVSMGLKGFVLNTSRGVLIEVEGPGADKFAGALESSLPPLCVIKTLNVEHLPPAGHASFEIRLSEPATGESGLVSPDISACPDCVREMHDTSDRRYLYPFINCTNCGPRYSIVLGVPYDRAVTTMNKFVMCPVCRAEYEDPANRRFHAQPAACQACGPKVEYIAGGVSGSNALVEAIKALKAGGIVAVKGLGGFQVACDAKNHAAVSRLRQTKRKSLKPFALMARDMATIKKFCHVAEAEEALLAGRASPIVLLKKKPGTDGILSPEVAPGNNRLGFMLPCTPLHHLLFRHPDVDGAPEALVMTSGNLSEEPIVIDNKEAVEKLSGLAGSFLTHDRDIYMRVDDSVARVVKGVPRLIRRARGYAPEPLELGREAPEILACGGELKNTLCVTKGGYAIMGQHIGDLTSYEAMSFFEETLGNLKRTFKANPVIVSHDLHPDYLSTRFAHNYAAENGGLLLVPVQHHHAHIAACMAENGYDGKVIGVAFDGTGHGTDGKTWGSEFLVAGYSGFERFMHIEYIPLPGGDKAVKEPWRTALSCLLLAYGAEEGLSFFEGLKKATVRAEDADIVSRMAANGVNSPPSCGMGRLFDAVSSLIGLKDRITFEGEAAIALEMAASEAEGVFASYPYSVACLPASAYTIEIAPMIRALVADIMRGASTGEMARKFHNTIADIILKACLLARGKSGLEAVALSGGVFQNALLFEMAEDGLRKLGFRVLTHSKVPANDGCISLGQAAVAAWSKDK